MRRKRTSKLISLLLALVMAFGRMPVTAADGGA